MQGSFKLHPEIERRAYIAAHAILASNLNSGKFATPGRKRTECVDVIANRIIEAFDGMARVSFEISPLEVVMISDERRLAVVR